MSEAHERWTDLLSDYLDGELSGDERRELETHLESCDDCRRVLGELSEVVRRAHHLAPVLPARDLWPGVADGIGAPAVDAARPVDPHMGGSFFGPSSRRPGRRGVWLSVPQLAAASVVLMLGSASLTWWTGLRLAPNRTATGPAESSLVMASNARGAAPGIPGAIAAQLRELEDTLAAARKTLDPTTERIIRRNLGVIDRAIAESRDALAEDPGDAFLKEHLDRTYERKVTYLREATRIVRGSSAP